MERPEPQVAIDDKLTTPPLDIEWEDGAYAAMIPRRRWLVGSFAIRGHLTVLVAPPGAGKSTLGIALAVAGITGRGEIVGETVYETIKAWVWNNEDDRNELRRRLGSRSCSTGTWHPPTCVGQARAQFRLGTPARDRQGDVGRRGGAPAGYRSHHRARSGRRLVQAASKASASSSIISPSGSSEVSPR